MADCEVMQLTIVQFSPKPQMSKSRSSTICAVVERHDYHCGDDIVIVLVVRVVTSYKGSVFSSPTDDGDYLTLARSDAIVNGRQVVTKRFATLSYCIQPQQSVYFALKGNRRYILTRFHCIQQFNSIACI